MSFESRYTRGSMGLFLGEVKEILGVVVTEEEINALVKAGKIEKDNYNSIPLEDVEMVFKWVKSGRPDPYAWDEPPLFSTKENSPATSGGISGDASDRLFKLTLEKMKEKGVDYITALNEVERENPDLARKITAELDEFRNRNKPDRLRG